MILAFSVTPISQAVSETLHTEEFLQKIRNAAETCIEKASSLDETKDGSKSKIFALQSRSMMDFYFHKSIKDRELTSEIEDVYSNQGAKCYELVDGEKYFWNPEKMKLLSEDEYESAIQGAKLGHVDKTDSPPWSAVIQDHLYVGGDLGTQPDVRRRMGIL